HRTVAVDGGAHDRVESAFHARNPGRLVPDLRRAALAGGMAFTALRLDDLLARALAGRGASAHRLGPMPAGLVDHVGDGARYLRVRELRIAAVRRHVADAFQRAL